MALTRLKKLKIIGVGAILSLLSFLALLFIFGRQDDHKIIVGAKNCTEQHILSEIVAQLLEERTELKVVRRFHLEGTQICFNALLGHTIDLYFEYTGTALLDILKEPFGEKEIYPYLKRVFLEKYGIVWLDRLGFTNQYSLIVRKDEGLDKLSELDSTKKIAIDPEFSMRYEFNLLKENYPHIKADHPKLLDQVILYFSLLHQTVDAVSGCSTDGRLIDTRFIFLQDDKRVFPKYEVAPLIRKKCLDSYPELAEILSLLKGKISEEEMRQLNYQVEFEGEEIDKLAKEFIAKAFD